MMRSTELKMPDYNKSTPQNYYSENYKIDKLYPGQYNIKVSIKKQMHIHTNTHTHHW